MTNIALGFASCYICHSTLISSCIFHINWRQCFQQNVQHEYTVLLLICCAFSRFNQQIRYSTLGLLHNACVYKYLTGYFQLANDTAYAEAFALIDSRRHGLIASWLMLALRTVYRCEKKLNVMW